MPALTRFVLRHKALVVFFWLAITAAGVLTISGTTHRMTNSFAMPGQAFRVDSQIASLYGNGGSQPPYVPVLTAPAGQRITDPATAAAAGRAFPDRGPVGQPIAQPFSYGAGAGSLAERLFALCGSPGPGRRAPFTWPPWRVGSVLAGRCLAVGGQASHCLALARILPGAGGRLRPAPFVSYSEVSP